MIEFRTLGPLHLTDSAGRELRGILQQPKRLALLAYLAIATQGGFHRRDTLVALFWPEHDQERARSALRKAVHDLRRWLGKEVLVTQGKEMLGLNPDLFWCDALAFAQAIQAGHRAEALTLYRGDLLEGFFVSGAPEVERWLDEQRMRLRRQAAEAAWRLAEEAEGDSALTVHWAHRAAALSPDDEEALRRVIALLDRVGDRAGAVRAYEEFARRLWQEYEVTPSPETRELIAAVRTRTGTAATVAPIRSRSGGSMPAGVERRARPAAPAGRAEEEERRAAEEAADPSCARVAVLPFTVHARDAYSYLAEGMVELLSTSLDGVGRLHSVDPRALLGFVAREGGGADPHERGRAVAQHFAAGLYVLGSIVEAGGRLRISASIYGRSGTEQASAQVMATEEEIFEAVDELTKVLVAGQQAGPGARLRRLAVLTTDSLPALKAYLEGESAFRLGQSALEAFRRAVELDPTFALAHYRLSIAAGFNFQIELERQAAAEALRHADRLSDRDRSLLEAYLAYIRGSFAEGERRYRTIVGIYPDEVEAWYQLGEVLFHLGPMHGTPLREARKAFERALFFDPENGESIIHLVAIAAADRVYERVKELFDRLEATGELPVQVRAIRAFVFGDPAAQEEIVAEFSRASDVMVAIAARYVAAAAPDLHGARRLARLLTEPSRLAEVRAMGHLLLAHWAFAEGRWQAARAELTALEAFEPQWALEYHALFAAAPFLPMPDAELATIRTALERMSTASAPPHQNPSPLFTVHDDLHPHLRAYLLGLLNARLGNHETAWCYAAELERLEGSPQAQDLGRSFAHTVHAHVACRRRAEEEGLRVLEDVRLDVPWELIYFSPFYGQAHERYLRAELLHALGRDEEALRWYDSLADYMAYHLIYLAPAHLRQGEIYERLGQVEKAADHYTRFVALWKECDPELRPRVAAAVERLKRLQ